MESLASAGVQWAGSLSLAPAPGQCQTPFAGPFQDGPTALQAGIGEADFTPGSQDPSLHALSTPWPLRPLFLGHSSWASAPAQCQACGEGGEAGKLAGAHRPRSALGRGGTKHGLHPEPRQSGPRKV